MKILHRAWFGPEPMPAVFTDYGREWQALNPDWTVLLWSEADVEHMGLRNQRIWDLLKARGAVSSIPHKPHVARATQMADVAAYEIIATHGGIYLNCDIEPLRPLADLPVTEDDAWACYEINHWLNNGAFGGPREHPFWEAVIDELPKRFDRMPGQPMHKTTGPHLLTDVAANVPGLHQLPRELFHFASYDDIPVGGDATPYKQAALDAGAIGLHHFAHRSKAMRTDAD